MISDLILFLFWQHEGEAKNNISGRGKSVQGD